MGNTQTRSPSAPGPAGHCRLWLTGGDGAGVDGRSSGACSPLIPVRDIPCSHWKFLVLETPTSRSTIRIGATIWSCCRLRLLMREFDGHPRQNGEVNPVVLPEHLAYTNDFCRWLCRAAHGRNAPGRVLASQNSWIPCLSHRRVSDPRSTRQWPTQWAFPHAQGEGNVPTHV